MRVLRRAFTSAAPFPAPPPAAASISSDLRAALEVAVTNADDTQLAPLNLLFMSASVLSLLLPLALPLPALLLLAALPPIEARNTPARNPPLGGGCHIAHGSSISTGKYQPVRNWSSRSYLGFSRMPFIPVPFAAEPPT
jgi:hypothetical protein